MEGSENIFWLLGNHSKTLFVSLGFCTYNTEFGTLFWWHFYKLRRQEGKNNITLLKYIGSRPLKQKRRENRIIFKSSTSNLIMALYAFYFWSCICIFSHRGCCVLSKWYFIPNLYPINICTGKSIFYLQPCYVTKFSMNAIALSFCSCFTIMGWLFYNLRYFVNYEGSFNDGL